MEAESWTTLSSSVASVLSLEGEDAAVGSSGGPRGPPTPTTSANLWGTAQPPALLLPAGLEGDLSSVKEDGAAELQLQGEGHLGESGAVSEVGWVHRVPGGVPGGVPVPYLGQ